MTVREIIIERLKDNDTILVWEDDYDRISDIAIFAFNELIDELISCMDQSADYKYCKTRKKTLQEIKEMLE